MKLSNISKKLPRREREAASRIEEIINAAESLFFKSGLEQASIDEIAETAEFSKTTVYKYFPSKEDLFAAVVLRGLIILTEMVQSSVSTNNTGYADLRAIGSAHAHFHREHPDYVRLFGRYVFSGQAISGDFLPESFPQLCINELRKLYDMLHKALEKGREDHSINPDLVSPVSSVSLATAINGILMLTLQLEPLYMKEFKVSYEDVMENYLELMLGAMKAQH